MGRSFKIDYFGFQLLSFLFILGGLMIWIGISNDNMGIKVITILIGVLIMIFAVWVIIDYQKRDN
ncbi:MAG: hypothetical protein ACFE8J_19080 [Candidatus Heimdallarchaeota archaeon]